MARRSRSNRRIRIAIKMPSIAKRAKMPTMIGDGHFNARRGHLYTIRFNDDPRNPRIAGLFACPTPALPQLRLGQMYEQSPAMADARDE